MKRLLSILAVLILVFSFTLPVFAEGGKVTYSGNSGTFIFEPGSDHSPTDLFSDFKSVMPGDTISQTITVYNNADDKVKVKLYMRSLGAVNNSDEFLSKLNLKVKKSDNNEMAYMFDSALNEAAQLTDWVLLGTLYSGGKVDLELSLTVPTELGNEFQNAIGMVDWEFKAEELPKESTDPKPPPTGDSSNILLWILLIVCLLIMILFIFFRRKKED